MLAELGIPKEVDGTCGIQFLEKNKITFFNNIKYMKYVLPNKGCFILTNKALIEKLKKIPGNTYIVVEDPALSFVLIHNAFNADRRSFKRSDAQNTIASSCELHPSVVLGGNVRIGKGSMLEANVRIGNDVSIGENAVIYPNVVIYDNVEIGKNCIIDSGTVIGADGFNPIVDAKGVPHLVIHTSGVKIGNNVEIGANSTIDRGTFKETIIEDNVKIDNHVHVGHNDVIKENARLAASCCIGGSTIIGRNVWVGIGATVTDNVEVGDDVRIQINAVVVSFVPAGKTVSGIYAMDNDAWLMHMKDLYKNYGQSQRVMRKSEK